VYSTAAFAGMTRVDKDAKWVYQTWSWLGKKTDKDGFNAYMKVLQRVQLLLLLVLLVFVLMVFAPLSRAGSRRFPRANCSCLT